MVHGIVKLDKGDHILMKFNIRACAAYQRILRGNGYRGSGIPAHRSCAVHVLHISGSGMGQQEFCAISGPGGGWYGWSWGVGHHVLTTSW